MHLGFYDIRKYFLLKHHILQKFCKKIPIYNKIYFLSKVTGFSYFKAILLSLDKIFSYCFLMYQRAKHINYMEIIAIF